MTSLCGGKCCCAAWSTAASAFTVTLQWLRRQLHCWQNDNAVGVQVGKRRQYAM